MSGIILQIRTSAGPGTWTNYDLDENGCADVSALIAGTEYDYRLITEDQTPTPKVYKEGSFTLPLSSGTVDDVLEALGPTGRLWLMTPEHTYTDAGKTTNATENDDVAVVADLSANGDDLTQTTSADQPVFKSDQFSSFIETDGVSEYIDVTFSSAMSQPLTHIVMFDHIPEVDSRLINTPTSVNMERAHSGIASGLIHLFANRAGINGPAAPRGPGWVLIEFNDTSTRVAVNGGDWITAVGNPGHAGLGGVRLGAAAGASPSAFTETRVRGVAVCEKVLSDQEKTTVDQFCREHVQPSYGSRATSIFAPSVEGAIIVAATESDAGAVTVPSFFPSVVDVSNDSDFDGVENGGGERLNYLLYTSTDHSTGGIYLTLGFGDPITGTWKRYDTALADGDLSAYSGSTPTAAGGKIFDDGASCETAWVGKVGTDWVMTYHPQDGGGPGVQRTKRASSSSPFGGFTVTSLADPNDIFLPGADGTNAYHTGYAQWIPVPPNATVSGSYFIRSLYQGAETAAFGFWTADSDMLNPSLIESLSRDADGDYNLTIPDYEYNRGSALYFDWLVDWGSLAWNGTNFDALGRFTSAASGLTLGTTILYHIRLNPDLRTIAEVVGIALAPNDLFRLKTSDNVGLPMTSFVTTHVVARPGGGHAMIVQSQGDEAGGEEYVIAMPMTLNV